MYGNFSAKSVTETKVDVTASWTALPTTAKSGRALLEVYNKDENKIYVSFDNTASIKERSAIGSSEVRIYPIQDNLTLYARTQTGGARVIVTEYK